MIPGSTRGLRVALERVIVGTCYKQMCHLGVDTFVISRPSTKAPDTTTMLIVPKTPAGKTAERGSSGNPASSFHCGDFVAFFGK